MDALQKVYAFYESCGGEKRVIGRSVCGQPIVALFVGEKGYPQLIVQYAIHAREWVTALLAPEHIRRGVPVDASENAHSRLPEYAYHSSLLISWNVCVSSGSPLALLSRPPILTSDGLMTR